MFTGIIETTGKIILIETDGNNKTFKIESPISDQLKIDQSVSHNGICLTVVELGNTWHSVTTIKETLELTSAKNWNEGDVLNIERAALLNSRLDGHLVQGHVDSIGKIQKIENENGSWRYTLSFLKSFAPLLISKGSITIDGVSLTAISPGVDRFQVAIIPYTYENTIFHNYKLGDEVNLEFDLIGKYILRSREIESIENN